MSDHLIAKHEINLGTFYFYTNYFVSEVKEGITISLDKLDEIIPLVLKYYENGEPFSYISNRINSHSILPHQYGECPLLHLDNFVSYATVTYSHLCSKSIEVEKHFAKRPFYNFSSLQEAITWVHSELDDIKNKS